MALLSMVVYDPPGESRHPLLAKCLDSLVRTVHLPTEHSLIVVSNGISDYTRGLIESYSELGLLDFMGAGQDGNIGTARAQNRAWKAREPGQHVCKVDPDIVFHEAGWLDKLEQCIAREPQIGLIGLKRKDVAESPNNPVGQWSHSTLKMLPHEPGETWLVVELVHNLIGSVCLHSSALLDKVGYLWQPGSYGYDDSDMSSRSLLSGFLNCFYPHYNVDHLDSNNMEYVEWKQKYAGEHMEEFVRVKAEYERGERPLWRDAE